MIAGVRERLNEKRREEERAAFEQAWASQDRGLVRVKADETNRQTATETTPAEAAPPTPRRKDGTSMELPVAPGFGAYLRAERKRLGISQVELARRAGAEHGSVSRIEHGSRRPSYAMVEKLADALALDGTDRAELFARAGFSADLEPVTNPQLRRIDALLNDPAVPTRTKETMAEVLNVVVFLGEHGETLRSKSS